MRFVALIFFLFSAAMVRAAVSDLDYALDLIRSSFKASEVVYMTEGSELTIYKEAKVQKAPRKFQDRGIDLIHFEHRQWKIGARTITTGLTLRALKGEVLLERGFFGEIIRVPLKEVKAYLEDLSRSQGYRAITVAAEK